MGGVIIAGVHSGTGKTTLTMGIIRTLTRQGLNIATAKVGPDYIDPMFHKVASGNTCYNLDMWAMRPQTIDSILYHLHSQSDMVICEGVMGLFDGAFRGGGSTADVAKYTQYPIVLVIDCQKHSTSVSAIVHGFDTLDKDICIAGVILNKVGSQKHRHILIDSFKKYVPHIPIMGIFHTIQDLHLPSRHLGLVQGCEHIDLEQKIERIAYICLQNIDINAVQNCANTHNKDFPKTPFCNIPKLGNHIAIAYDMAFQFVYPHIITAWQLAGVKISYFSPLNNEIPSKDADAIYLCGGYPELYLPTLQKAHNFKNAICRAVQKNIPVYGECGGYMVMGQKIIGADNISYDMIGVLDHSTDFSTKQRTLSYQTASVMDDKIPLAPHLRGHSFHYATSHTKNKHALYQTTDTNAITPTYNGGVKGSAFGSFFHMIDVADTVI